MPKGHALLGRAVAAVQQLMDGVEKGTIEVCVFNLVVKNTDQFIKLCTSLFSQKNKSVSVSVIQGIIDQRSKELHHFTRIKEQIAQFVQLCKESETVKGR